MSCEFCKGKGCIGACKEEEDKKKKKKKKRKKK
jgi:hypothetical protein